MRHLSLLLSTLYFETGSLTEPETQSVVQPDLGPSSLHLLSAGILDTLFWAQVLCGCWVSKLMSLCLDSKHLPIELSLHLQPYHPG